MKGLCNLCMPEAFCELEMCAKNLRELCALCERKNSPANLKRYFSHGGCVLFLTEEHRWTEHTGFHRDIKSTDYTEPYSHRSLTPLPHSIQEHALLHLRTCPSTAKNTPLLMLDKALLQRSLQPPDFMQVTETDRTYILNGKLMLIDRMTERHRMTERTCFVVYFMFTDIMTQRHIMTERTCWGVFFMFIDRMTERHIMTE